MRASVVINLRSSGSERHLRHLPGHLAERGIEVDDLITVQGSKLLAKSVKRLAKRDTEVILVGGGDGTMMMAANELVHRDTVMGVLPLGTGNSFSQTLGIGTELPTALDAIAGGRVVSVDLGVVNDIYFVNFATLGLSAEIADNTAHALKPVIGPLAYAIGGVMPFLRAKPFKARIKTKDIDLKLDTQQMVIASGRFFGKTPVLEDASATNGKLAFFTTEGCTHFDVARMYVAFGLGLQNRLPDAHSFYARKIKIRADRKVPISLDGNTMCTTPATFRIEPRALRVFVPAGYHDEGK